MKQEISIYLTETELTALKIEKATPFKGLDAQVLARAVLERGLVSLTDLSDEDLQRLMLFITPQTKKAKEVSTTQLIRDFLITESVIQGIAKEAVK